MVRQHTLSCTLCIMLPPRMAILLIAGISLALLCGCQSTPAELQVGNPAPVSKAESPDSVYQMRERLIGWWFGERITSDGAYVQWISRRSESGQFSIRFRVKESDGSIYEGKEIGEWGITGNMYIVITRGRVTNGRIEKTDTSDPYYWDAYEIIHLTKNRMQYRSFEDGVLHNSRRVSKDFDFPN